MNKVSTNTSFCLSGATIISPRETVMGHCSNKDTSATASQISELYIDKPYEELKKGRHIVKISDESFICPYCPKKIKRGYVYREILEHAAGVGNSNSQKRSVTEKANHLALVKYLKMDLVNVDGPSKPTEEGDILVTEAIIKYNKFSVRVNCLPSY